jgi:integrase
VRISVKQRWTFDRIWDEYKGVKTIKGIRTDESRYQKHLCNQFGNREPTDLVPSDIDQFRAQLLRKYSPQTVAHILSLLRRLVNFARQRNLCDVPSFKIELPRANNEKTEDLTPEQLTRLLEVLNKDPNRTAANMMKLALFNGMRRGEMLRLKWSDIDNNRGFILIRGPKGGQDQKIPLNNAAREIFEEQPKISEYVFPGRNGKQRVDITKEVNRIKKTAGLPKDFQPLHGLRHVFASMLASSGQVDMYTLQKLLTHKSPIMTQRYAHLRDEALKKASNLAGEIVAQNINSVT